MATAVASASFPPASPRLKSRIAGAFYSLTIVLGIIAFIFRDTFGVTVNVVSHACFVVVAFLFYDLFKPVNRSVSLIAMAFGLAGCVTGIVRLLNPGALPISSMVFFGVHCLLIGYLSLRSAFMPRIIGVLMVIAGLMWLTNVAPQLAKSISPLPSAMGLLAEGTLALWLLVIGVDEQRWKEQV